MTARASACSATSGDDAVRRLRGDGRRAADPRMPSSPSSARSPSSRRAASTARCRPTIRSRTSIATASCTRPPCRRRLSEDTAGAALAAALSILKALDYVGVIGVEFFVTPDGGLAGQRDRAARAQFRSLDGSRLRRLAVRAACARHRRPAARIAGAPLGLRHGKPDRRRHSARAGTAGRARTSSLQLYGKAEARPGRKMGHFTRLLPRSQA